jgi:uncharacterized protein (DUF2267 family)
VQYQEFITAVADRSGLSREDAENLVHATLRVLAERISGGEAEDLKAQMPKQLQVDLIPPQEEAQSFGADEFARRVAQRSGMSEADAGAGVIAVLATIREAVTPGEFDDVLAQLGKEFAELVEGTS